MPLVQIHLVKGKSPKYIKQVADSVHLALENAWNIPSNARFQLIHEYPSKKIIFDKTFWNASSRTKDPLFIVVGTVERSIKKKRTFYEEVVKQLQKSPGIPKTHIFIQLIPVKEENFWL